MELSDRQNEILALIRHQERVEVDALSAYFDVSTQTIRRDLNLLCARGLASRTHGGARQVVSISNENYDSRRQTGGAEKASIAQLVASHIPDGCSLMMNIGTTTEQVAHALYEHKDLIVVSNNVNIVSILSGSPSKELVLTGGTVRQSDGAIVGSMALDVINRYKVDFAIIGCSAIDEDGTILDFDAREVAVSHAILANARQKILVADHRKFSRSATVRIGHIKDIDAFYTDKMPVDDFVQIAQQHNTDLFITESQ